MPELRMTVANSKLLAEATKKALKKNDDGSKYQVQLTLQTPVIRGLSAAQAATFLGKCKQAFAQFKDDLELRSMGLLVEKDNSEFNASLIKDSHEELLDKLGLNSAKEEKGKAKAKAS